MEFWVKYRTRKYRISECKHSKIEFEINVLSLSYNIQRLMLL